MSWAATLMALALFAWVSRVWAADDAEMIAMARVRRRPHRPSIDSEN
jgi:hypothetical protein